MRSTRTILSALAVLTLLAAACSNGDSTSTSSSTSSAAGGGTDTPSSPAASDATIATAETDLGTVLVDADGFTLYLFEQDTDGTSTCTGDCAVNWPAATVEGDPVAGDGVDASLIGTTEGTDGSTQITYDGHPLYRFAGDAAAGTLNGQGVGDVWYVVSPDGQAVTGTGAQARAGY